MRNRQDAKDAGQTGRNLRLTMMKRETSLWVEDAEYDLESARAMLDSGRLFFVVFMCHLVVEKLLKAAIVEHCSMEPPKTHNLVGLAARSEIEIPDEYRTLVNELDGMGVVTRYPEGRRALAGTLTDERAKSMYSRTAELAKWLKEEIGSRPS